MIMASLMFCCFSNGLFTEACTLLYFQKYLCACKLYLSIVGNCNFEDWDSASSTCSSWLLALYYPSWHSVELFFGAKFSRCLNLSNLRLLTALASYLTKVKYFIYIMP